MLLIAGVKEAPDIAQSILGQGYELRILAANEAFRLHLIDEGMAHCLLCQMDPGELVEFLGKNQIHTVVDASSESNNGFFNALASMSAKPRYIRYFREELDLAPQPLIITVYSFEEAANKIAAMRAQTVFLTTGSYRLEAFRGDPRLESTRIVVRTLPDWKVIKKCQETGVPAHDIVAMQGPFSKRINRVLFKTYNADVVVTRDSGKAGGADTKISAALELEIPIILIKRKTSQEHLTACGVLQLEKIFKR